jgi:hypothetical protein
MTHHQYEAHSAKGAGSKRAWPSSKPCGVAATRSWLRRILTPVFQCPPARSQVEARGKIVDRDRASMRGNDLKNVLAGEGRAATQQQVSRRASRASPCASRRFAETRRRSARPCRCAAPQEAVSAPVAERVLATASIARRAPEPSKMASTSSNVTLLLTWSSPE